MYQNSGCETKPSYFWTYFSALGAYFSKPIFALKSRAQAGRFEYHGPYKLNFAFQESLESV